MQHSLSWCFVDHPTLWKHIVLSLFLVLCGVLLCIALLCCICDGLLSRVFGIRFCLPFCLCFSYIIAAKVSTAKNSICFSTGRMVVQIQKVPLRVLPYTYDFSGGSTCTAHLEKGNPRTLRKRKIHRLDSLQLTRNCVYVHTFVRAHLTCTPSYVYTFTAHLKLSHGEPCETNIRR